ncbi:MAG: RNA polymerase sigma factor [Ktedonobacterales bacterium]
MNTSVDASAATFDAFFARYEQPLYAYLRQMLPATISDADALAADLTQEAFFRAWAQFERLRHYERPAAWLFRVATNLAISQLRRHQPMSFSRLAHEPGHDPSDAKYPSQFDDSASFTAPINLEEQAITRDLIAAALRQLPERQRAALLLRAAQGFAVAEVADILGINVANTHQLLSRASRHFREVYEALASDVSEHTPWRV